MTEEQRLKERLEVATGLRTVAAALESGSNCSVVLIARGLKVAGDILFIDSEVDEVVHEMLTGLAKTGANFAVNAERVHKYKTAEKKTDGAAKTEEHTGIREPHAGAPTGNFAEGGASSARDEKGAPVHRAGSESGGAKGRPTRVAKSRAHGGDRKKGRGGVRKATRRSKTARGKRGGK